MTARGAIELACAVRGDRSRITTLRTAGLSRASRTFAEQDGAARLILSVLGPGIIAGDEFCIEGIVQTQSRLITTGQMSTPVFAGAAPSRSRATWNVLAGAALCVINEPLIVEPGSRHRSETWIDVDPSGIAIIADTVALRGASDLTIRTVATTQGSVVVRDAIRLTERSVRERAAGSIIIVAPCETVRTSIASMLDELCTRFAPDVRCGIGATSKAVIIRLLGRSVWHVHAAVTTIAQTVRSVPERSGMTIPSQLG